MSSSTDLQGLVNALETQLPNAEIRFCVLHLYANMKKEYRGAAVRKYLWYAARSTSEYNFSKNMEALKKVHSLFMTANY